MGKKKYPGSEFLYLKEDTTRKIFFSAPYKNGLFLKVRGQEGVDRREKQRFSHRLHLLEILGQHKGKHPDGKAVLPLRD